MFQDMGQETKSKKVIERINSKIIISIHTEHEDHFDKLHNNIRKVNLNETMEFMR